MQSTVLTKAILVTLSAAVLTLSACSSEPEEPKEERVSVVPPDQSENDGHNHDTEESLTVDIDSTGTSCLGESAPKELAWFDATWKATADLESFSFTLTNPVGVQQVGTPVTVPPVNYGGRIDFGGAASWSGHAKAIGESSLISWPQRDDTDFWSPIADQTGMLVFHIRLDPKALAAPEGASFDGVTATYLDLDGDEHEVAAAGRNVFTLDGSQCGEAAAGGSITPSVA